MSYSSHADEDDDVEIEEEYLGDYASVRSIVKQALPFQILATIGGAVAGLIFAGMTNELGTLH